MAACEAARLVLISIAQAEREEQPMPPISGECPHPASQVQPVGTFGETVYFCAVCGEQVGV